jgi:tetratricopeptide (TPR) repeat protein
MREEMRRDCPSSRWTNPQNPPPTNPNPTVVGENRDIGERRLLGNTYVPRSQVEATSILWRRAAVAFQEQGDLAGALRCYRRAIEVDADCSEAWAGLADLFRRLGDPQRAGACGEVAFHVRDASLGAARG